MGDIRHRIERWLKAAWNDGAPGPYTVSITLAVVIAGSTVFLTQTPGMTPARPVERLTPEELGAFERRAELQAEHREDRERALEAEERAQERSLHEEGIRATFEGITTCSGKPLPKDVKALERVRLIDKDECPRAKQEEPPEPPRPPQDPRHLEKPRPPEPRPGPNGLTPQEQKQANDGAEAIGRYCLEWAKGNYDMSNEVVDAFARASYKLPDLLRKDPDTYYKFAYSGRSTMRQLVGEARDMMATGDCDPHGARRFTTDLETLPN